MVFAMKLRTMIFLSALLLTSACSHHTPAPYYSSRDVTPEEQLAINEWTWSDSERAPANWFDSCVGGVTQFFKPKPQAIAPQRELPQLTQLNPVEKKFPNGKKYTEYTANTGVMNKYPDYDTFLEETAEVIFEPTEPFGHIYLRIGKKVHTFNNVQWTSVSSFSPRLRKSSNPELMSSTGFVFHLGKEKIDPLLKEIAALYSSSQSHNVPAFDAYSPMLKIEERDGMMGGKKLFYVTDSPKYGNDKEIKGKLVEVNGVMVLDAGNGITVPVVKKGDHYYTQSYSCSSSAGHVLEKFFGLKVAHAYSAKSLAAALSKGNINESISPVAVIKYYEE